jgi:hypothetical protein
MYSVIHWLSEAELAGQLLAGREVEEVVRPVVRGKNSPGGAEEHEGYDACGHGTSRTGYREDDSAPDCRGYPTVEPKHQSDLQAIVSRNDEGGDLLREIGAGTANGMGADEFVHGEGLDAAGLPAVGLVEGDDIELALGGTGQLRGLPRIVRSDSGDLGRRYGLGEGDGCRDDGKRKDGEDATDGSLVHGQPPELRSFDETWK